MASEELLRRENAELRAREERYREGLQRQLELSRRLRAYAAHLRAQLREHPPRAAEAVFAEVADVSADALGVGRVSVWLVERERGVLRCGHLLVRGEPCPLPPELPLGEVAAYLGALDADALAIEDAAADPRVTELRTYCAEHQVGALLDVPVVAEGEVLGVIRHEHLGGPRRWHDAELDFAANLGGVVALAIEAERRVEADRRLEAELAQQRKFESLGRMAASVAHDFNNVLTVISLAASRGRTADIDASLTYARGLVTSLMAYARRTPIEAEDVEVDEALARLQPVLATAAGEDVQLEVALGAAGRSVRIPPTELNQLVVNMVTNAGEATRGHGRLVRVSTSSARGPAGPAVEIRIADDGRGMDEATRSRAFDPFFTTKPPGQGTGIGLATCQSIVARAGGTIAVDSAPGTGTTFRIVLPAVAVEEETAGAEAREAEAEAREAEAEAEDEAAEPARQRVLLVEDSPTLADLISFMLRNTGYDVALAKTVAEAREAIENEIFEVVLTDLRMPDGRGEDVVAAARARSARTAILVASGEATVISGIDGMVMKPFMPDDLKQAIAGALAHRRETPGAR